MEELIHIKEGSNGRKAVSAIELYQKLGFNTSHYAKWANKYIVNSEYAIESEDYVVLAQKAKTSNKGGRPSQDYVLSLNFAKRLSMMAKTEQGDVIRQYFISMEKVAIESVKAVAPADPMEALRLFFQVADKQTKQIESLTKKVEKMETKDLTRSDWTAIVGYGTRKGMSVGINLAAALGRRATKLCRIDGIEPEKIHDPRFGFVNTYPDYILEQVFNEPEF